MNENLYPEILCYFELVYNTVVLFQTELKHTVEHLHEEQERIVKIEAIKKSLEIEVKVIYT